MALSTHTKQQLAFGLGSQDSANELATAVDASTTNAASSASPTFTGTVTLADTTNCAINATTGSQIGTASNQKIGFWGATPVVQPSGTGELLGLNGNAATAANATNMNSNGNVGTKNYTFNDLVKALKQAGAIASS